MNYKHGLSHSRIDVIYKDIIARCYNPNNNRYNIYGARGITICDEWKNNKESFFKWAYDNWYKENLSIDRIDVNKGYSPDNCRWATPKQQANNRSSNRLITINGETHTMAEWGDIKGIGLKNIWNRINSLGWSEEDAVNKTMKKGGNN